ncbi:hypothetical protein GBAR_LOCUS29952 [Geodia barretti]|uniref:Uncharacterized protein n=1 Tax=Geodia barretti TaxID=519541 RepID=A0AA35TUW7_GEOBA|nr:hypothetical protein GBAR_LOCUS29952 [Geodia barretti]
MDITGGEGVDHIVEVDFAANFPVTSEVLKSSGVVAIYAAGTGQQPPVPLQFRRSNTVVRNVLVYDMPEPAKEAAIADITAWLEVGQQDVYADSEQRDWDSASQVTAMDNEGIDVAVLFPSRGLFTLGDSDLEPAFATAISRAYNDWLADFCSGGPGRLFGAG